MEISLKNAAARKCAAALLESGEMEAAKAERYAGYLGKVNVGYVAKAGGGYEWLLKPNI